MSAEDRTKTRAEELAEWQRAWKPIWDARGGGENEDEEVVAEEPNSEESSGQPRPSESYFGNYNADLTAPED